MKLLKCYYRDNCPKICPFKYGVRDDHIIMRSKYELRVYFDDNPGIKIPGCAFVYFVDCRDDLPEDAPEPIPGAGRIRS